ncbi:hypothetical protein SISNIDRAFT_357160 [Sistotremastrum niveocremeum HHB9708]|uniref:Secreted protein n=2 Tax=Sistotremastraceae TaxID=3402574 RepID=A0A164WJJ0_9AGAM|nr:hypothetical protein SISNIDRAFT_357160 [Sistotremastrum niveocremeum HHB9708]KZT34630.1 hypothetical protein SISSUDRAFT_256146 [Sistotremastrum suecicum HHB10207 ss-3]
MGPFWRSSISLRFFLSRVVQRIVLSSVMMSWMGSQRTSVPEPEPRRVKQFSTGTMARIKKHEFGVSVLKQLC